MIEFLTVWLEFNSQAGPAVVIYPFLADHLQFCQHPCISEALP